MSEKYSSIWEANIQVQEDDKSVVDGVNILAKVSGPSFFPDKTSRNHVHYPRLAWENALKDPDFQQRLKERRVYGTIGHDVEMNDEAVRAGNFSHIVSRVWIDDNGVGNAEYLILNTPPGRILNTLFRAGSKIYVSTKAGGEFERQEGDIKYVDPDVFFLERIDFVIDPGFLETNPQLLESYKNLTRDNKRMSEINEANAKIKELQESLDKYQQLGSYEKLSQCVDLLEEYIKLGSVKKISETLQKSTDRISQLTQIIQKGFTDVNEAINVDNMKDLLEQYKALGTPAEIKQLIKVACDQHKTIMEARAGEISKKYGISESFVRKQYNKGMKMSDIEEMLKSLKEDAVTEPACPEVKAESDSEETSVNTVAEADEDEEGVDPEAEADGIEAPAEEPAEVEDADDDEVDVDVSLDEEPEEEEPEESCKKPIRESYRRSFKTSDIRRVAKQKKINESRKAPSYASSSLVSKLMGR